jgi:rhodanese-related sulfurtransferase
VVTLAACGGDDADNSAGPVQADGQSVDVDDFATLTDTAGVVVLDVRTPQEYAEGLAGLDPAATYAVYCRSGNRSQTALALMRDAGISAVVDLSGGIQAWTQAGNDVVTGP